MANKIDLGGKNAMITGGVQKIARAIVARLAATGAAVTIRDRDGGRATH
jgi:NAD(P)-dependent dehydrogenase (short-subunit alcohol dehydrogenase family)